MDPSRKGMLRANILPYLTGEEKKSFMTSETGFAILMMPTYRNQKTGDKKSW
jgi:hypothetical protein